MRHPLLLWSVSAVLSLAVLPAQELSPPELLRLARERAAEGDVSGADSTLSGLLLRRPEAVALWEEAIRMQAQWGSFDEAYKNARMMNLRRQLGGGSASPSPLLVEVQGLLEQELSGLLSLTAYESGDLTGLVNRLKLTVAFSPEKSAKVVEHLFALMRAQPSGNSKSGDVAAGFLVKLGEVPELSDTVLRLAEAGSLTSQRDWCEEYASTMVRSQAWDRPECLARFLARSPLTAAVDRFLDLELPRRSQGTLLGVLADELRNDHNLAWRWEALQALNANASPRFGASLLRHLMTGGVDAASLRQFLQAHQKDLARLTDRAAGNVLAVLRSRHGALSQPLDPGLKTLLGPLIAAEEWHLNGVRLDWKRVKGIEEMKLTPEAARSLALATVRRLVVHDPGLARDYLTDVVRLMGDSDLLNELLIEAACEPELLGTILKLAGGTRLAVDPGWEQTFFLRAWNNEMLEQQPERLAVVLEAVGLLGDAEDVLRWLGEGNEMEKGVLARVVKDVSKNSRHSTLLRPVLEKRGDGTFGLDLTTAFLKPDVRDHLLLVTRKHRVELEGLPAGLKSRLASFLMQWVGNEVLLASAVPAFAEVLKVSLTDRTTEVLAELARLEAASRIEDLYPGAGVEFGQGNAASGQPSESMTRIVRILSDAMMIDPGEAAHVFGHVSSMVHTADRVAAERTADKRLGVLGLWLLAAMDHRNLHPLVQKELGKIVLQRADYSWVEKAEKRLLPPADFAEASRLVARLEQCGILAPGDEYQPLNLARYCTMLETLSRRIAEITPQVRREALKQLEARSDRGFGTVVTIAFLQPTWQEADPGLAAIRPVLDYRPDEESLALRRALVKLFPDIEVNPAAEAGTGVVAMLQRLHKKEVAREARLRPEPDKPRVIASTQAGREEAMAEMSRLMSRGEVGGVRQLFQGLITSAGPAQKTPPGEMLVWLCREKRRQRLLERCLENPPAADVAGILLGCAALDESGQMGLAGTQLADDVAPSLELAWVEAGGLVQPAEAAEEVLVAFARGMTGAPAYVAVPTFSRWLASMPAAGRKLVLAWAAQVASDKPWKSLAVELQRAGALARSFNGETKERGDFLNHYASCVQDQTVPFRMRLDLAAHLCLVDASALPPPLIMTATELALQSWQKGDLCGEEEMLAVWKAFSHLPDNAAWRSLAGRIIAHRNHLIVEAGKMQTWGSPEASRVILTLSGRLKDMKVLEPIVDDREVMIYDQQYEVALLARCQQPDLAVRVVRRDWRYLAGGADARLETPTWSLPYQDQDADSLIASFPDDVADFPLLARAFLLRAALPVPGRDGEDPAVSRARALKLAGEIAVAPRSGRGLRSQLDRFLVGLYPETLFPLADSLAVDAAEDAWHIGASTSNYYGGGTANIAMNDGIRLLDGDLDVMSVQMKRLGEVIRSIQNYGASEAMGSQAAYLMQLMKTVAGNASRLSLAQRSEWILKLDGMLRELGPPPEGGRVSHAFRDVCWIVDRWMEARGLREPRPWVIEDQSVASLKPPGGSLKMLAELAAESPGAPTKEMRTQLAIAAARTPELYFPAGERWKNLCDLLLSSKLVTVEELVAISPELLSAMRNSAKAALELAAVANDRGNLEMAERLLEMGLSDNRVFDEASLPIGHFDALERAAARRSLVIRRASLLIAMKQGDKARHTLLPMGAPADDKAIARLLKLAGEGSG